MWFLCFFCSSYLPHPVFSRNSRRFIRGECVSSHLQCTDYSIFVCIVFIGRSDSLSVSIYRVMGKIDYGKSTNKKNLKIWCTDLKMSISKSSVRFSIIGSFEQPLEYFYFSLILWACYLFAEQQTMATLMIVKDHLLAAIFNIYIVCVCLCLSSGILRCAPQFL